MKKQIIKLNESEIDTLVCALLTHREEMKKGKQNEETRFELKQVRAILRKFKR